MDGVAVQGVRDRLANFDVVERRHRLVQVDHGHFSRVHRVGLDARHLLQAGKTGLVLAGIDHVELTRLEGQVARRVGRD